MVVLRRKDEVSHLSAEENMHSRMSDQMGKEYPLDVLNIWVY